VLPVNRIEIETKLHRGRIDALETVTAMEAGELNAPRTRSEHDEQSWWSFADHFVHTTLIERDFNAIIRRHVGGEQGMNPALVDSSGSALRSREEVMAWVHRFTESWKVEHQDKPLDELVRVGLAVRSDTLSLLCELTDEQLLSVIPGAPWADGTVGGIMSVHADHWFMHKKWATAGTGARQEELAD
jgi:hypothetical protein